MASRWLKLWTASAITVALLHAQGCQSHHSAVLPASVLPNEDAFLPEPATPPAEIKAAPSQAAVAASHPAGERVVLPPTSRYWSSRPTARIFRGSVSSVSNQNDLIAR